MEVVSVKLEEPLLEEIDSVLIKYRYGTRSEFIRGAIRNQLRDLEKEDALKRVEKYYSASKRKTTNKQLHEAGEKAMKELASKFNVRLD